MLEAGRNYEPATETPMMQVNAEAPLRGSGTPEKPFGFWDATIDGGWDVPGEPYTSASDDPARKFVWWRARMLGGRTNHWGRISLRNGPYDFKPHTRDGLGFDWPIGYEDLAPYYDKVEMLIGVYGANDGLENTPNSSAGRVAAAAQAARERPADPAARAQARHSRDRRAPRRAHEATRSQAAAEMLHPGNAKAQKILAADMQKRARVFLRHALRPRLLDPRELPVDHRAPAAGARHRQSRHHHRCHGARRQQTRRWRRRRRDVTSTEDRRRASREGARGRAGRERARIGAHPAEFRRRQQQRQGRQIHHGHRGRELQRPGARCSRTCRCTTKTASTACTCTRRGGCTRSNSPASSVSRAATTSSSAADARCPAWEPPPVSNG